MNEEAMKNLQELLENLSKDSEAAGLKSEIASLEAKLANPDYYKTPNKADGTPAQTGDFGREYRNYSSHMNSVNESLNNLVNKKIEEIRNVQNGLDQTVEQLQLTGDENAIAEASQAAEANREVLNRLTELSNNQTSLVEGAEQTQLTNDETAIAEANAAVEANRQALDEMMMSFEDSADRDEYQRLLDDRAEEIKEHEDFLARAEALQARDENGNVYLDKNGNPVVNVNLYNMISDEKKLVKAREAYANTNLGKLENVMASFNVNTNDIINDAEEPVVDNTIAEETPVEADIPTVEGEQVIEEAPVNSSETIDASDIPTTATELATINPEVTEDQTFDKYNTMILNGESFMNDENNIVLVTSLIKAGDTEVSTWTNAEGIAQAKTAISSLTPTGQRASIDEIENMCSDDINPEVRNSLQSIIYKEKHNYYFEHPEFGKVIPESEGVLEGGIVQVRNSKDEVVEVKLSDLVSSDVLVDKEIDNTQTTEVVDAKLAADRKANLAKALDDYAMNGSMLDQIEQNGFYLPSEKVAKEAEDDIIIEMPKKEETETVVAAVAANAVDTKPAEEMVEESKANESEENDMAKVQKESKVQYSEATPEQKKQAKGKLTTLQKILIGAGFVGTFAGVLFGLNKLNNNNGPEQETTTIETETPEELEEVEDKTLDDIIGHNKHGDEDEKEPTVPSTNQTVATNPTPAPSPLPDNITDMEQQMAEDAWHFGVQGNMIGYESHQTSLDPSQASVAAVNESIANGEYKPGDTITFYADNGTVSAQVPVYSVNETREEHGPNVPGSQPISTSETVVEDNVVLPQGVTNSDVVTSIDNSYFETPAPSAENTNDVITVEEPATVNTVDGEIQLNAGETFTASNGDEYTNLGGEEVLPDLTGAIEYYDASGNAHEVEEGGRSL